jgi:type IV secretion system protein VirD4
VGRDPRATPARQPSTLYVHVCKMETLRAAYEMAKRNDGAPGIDGVTFEAIEVLGRFDAILNGVGELPGYGLSIWTFWQSRSQLVDTYNVNGADTMIATAEMLNIFNLPASLPKENEYWSNAIGTYTGIKITTTPDSKTGKPVQTKTTEELRLVPASDLPKLLQKNQIMFLNSLFHTPDRVKLKRTVAHDDPRFASLVDFQAPVGKSG